MSQCFITWAGSWGSDGWDDLPRLHRGVPCTPDLRMPRSRAWKPSGWCGARDRVVMDLSGTEASERSTLALMELAVLGVLDKCPLDSEIRWKIWKAHLVAGWPRSWQRSCHLPVGKLCPWKDVPRLQPESLACKTSVRTYPWSAL